MSMPRLALFCCLFAARAWSLDVWTSYYDTDRTGANLQETILNASNVNVNRFGKLWAYPVVGDMYAQPLYMSNVDIPGRGVRNVLYIGTMQLNLYAFDADQNELLWSRDYKDPVNGIGPAVLKEQFPFYSGNIASGVVGIESCPVIDRDTGTLYFVTQSKVNNSDNGYRPAYPFHLRAVDMRTGADKFGGSVVINGSVPGTGQGSVNRVLTFSNRYPNQRLGLALAKGQVIIGFGSHEDQNQFHGWLFAYDAGTLRQTAVFCPSADGIQGGIWHSGRAPAVDEDGNLFLATGNGPWDGVRNWGMSYLKLDPARNFTVLDFHTPFNYSEMNKKDYDVGASGVILLPGTGLVLGGGKHMYWHLLNRSDFGGYNPTFNRVYQEWPSWNGTKSDTAQPKLGWMKTGPVYWYRENDDPLMFAWGIAQPLFVWRFNRTVQKFVERAEKRAPWYNEFTPALSLSADGERRGTGVVWANCWVNGLAEYNIVPGILRAYDAEDITKEIWNSNMNKPRDNLYTWAKFVPPIVANGRVYVPNSNNTVVVYGLLASLGPTTQARATTAVATTALGSATTGLAGPPALGSALRTVPSISCQNSQVTLEVRSHRWNVDGQMAFTTRAYFYDGQAQLPGPTIVMKAGTQCTLTLVNKLSEDTSVSRCHYHQNSFHCPDTTNIHTHGLHVSPLEDDVSLHITPGMNHSYVYNILPNHLMGTHWYHAHSHGSVNLQVLGGLAGALLVEPASDYVLPADLAALYAGSPPVLVLQHIVFGGDDMDNDPAFMLLDYVGTSAKFAQAPEAFESYPPQPDYFTGERDFFVVNGQFRPTVAIQPDSVALLRIVQASAMRMVELELVDPNGWCQWQTISRDGVFQYAPYQTNQAIVLAPGNRADVAVKCSGSAANRTVYVRSNPSSIRDQALGTQNRHAQSVVFALVVGAPAGIPGVPSFPTSQAPMPEYLDPVMDDPLSFGGQNVSEILLSAGSDDLHAVNLRSFPGFGVPDDQKYVERLCLNNVYEFNVVPPQASQSNPSVMTAAHPYHQHVNHFQIVGINGVDPASAADVVRIGEWRDTVPALAVTGVRIRFKTHTFTGDAVLHCHILQHEDLGMMGLFQIAPEGASDCVYVPRNTTGDVPVGYVGGTGNESTWRDVDTLDFRFVPQQIYVGIGQTVRWTNRGVVAHSTTSGMPGMFDGRFDSDVMNTNAVYLFTFTIPGTYQYYCKFHGGMTGTVTVLGPTGVIPSSTGSAPAGTTGPAADDGYYHVVIQNYVFIPDPARPPVGQPVKFTNLDVDIHSVTSGSREDSHAPSESGPGGDVFNGILEFGQSFVYTFNTPGLINYYCLYHPGMDSTIEVQPPSLTTGTVPSNVGCDNYLDLGQYGQVFLQDRATTSNFPITISLWIYMKAPVTVDACIFWNGQMYANGQGIIVRRNGFLAVGNSLNVNMANSSYALPVGEWVFLSAVVTAAKSWSLYANGVFQASVNVTVGDLLNPGTKLSVGGHGGNYNAPGNGNINARLDSLMVWNEARTPAQLAADMAASLAGTVTGFEPNLAFFLPFNEGSGNRTFPVGTGASKGPLSNSGVISWGTRSCPVRTTGTTSTGTSSTGTTSTGTTSTGTTSTGTTSTGTTAAGTTAASISGSPPSINYVVDFGTTGTGFFQNKSFCPTSRTTDVTISAWVRLAAYKATTQVVAFVGTIGINGYGIVIAASPTLSTGYLSIAYRYENVTASSYSLPLDEWVYVSLASPSLNTWQVYANGVLRDTITGIAGTLMTPTNRIFAGGSGQTYKNNLNGKLDAVQVWHGVRSPAQLVADAQPGALSGFEPDLMVWLPFSEGAGIVTEPVGNAAGRARLQISGTVVWAVADYALSPTTTAAPAGSTATPPVDASTASAPASTASAPASTAAAAAPGTTAAAVPATTGTTGAPAAIGCNSYVNFTQYGQVVLKTSPAMTQNVPVTLSTWIYLNAPSTRDACIMWNGAMYSNGNGLIIRAGNILGVGIGAQTTTTNTSYALPTQEWVFLSAVSDTLNQWRIYANGVLQTTVTLPGTAKTPNSKVSVGGHGGNYNAPGNGNINAAFDNVMIWTVARTPAELQSDMQYGTITGSEPGLALFLPFNEGSGNTTVPVGTGAALGTFLVPGLFTWEERFCTAPTTGTTSTGTTSTGTTSTGTTSTGTTGVQIVCDSHVNFTGWSGQIILKGPSLLPTVPVTYSAWVYMHALSTAATGGTILSNGQFNFNGETVNVLPDGRISVIHGTVFGNSTYVLPLRQWKFLSVTCATSNEWKVYENGVLQSTFTVPGPAATIPNFHFSVAGRGGAANSNSNGNFNGMIDSVMVWNTARSASQLASDMNGVTGWEDGLLLYLPFSEGFGVNTSAVGYSADRNPLYSTGTFRWAERCYPAPAPLTTASASAPVVPATTGVAAPATTGRPATTGQPATTAEPAPVTTAVAPAASTAALPEETCDTYVDFSFYGQLVLQRAVVPSNVPLTFSVWIYLKAPATRDANIMWNGGMYNNGNGVVVRAGNIVGLGVGAQTTTTNTSYALPTQEWVFLSAVSETLNEWRIYANGVLQTTVTLPGTARAASGKFQVGGHGGNYNAPGNGNINARMDSVMFWTVARTPEQLALDMQPGGVTGFEPGLALYLPFNEGFGNTTMPVGTGASLGALKNSGLFAWGERCGGADGGVPGAMLAESRPEAAALKPVSNGQPSSGSTQEAKGAFAIPLAVAASVAAVAVVAVVAVLTRRGQHSRRQLVKSSTSLGSGRSAAELGLAPGSFIVSDTSANIPPSAVSSAAEEPAAAASNSAAATLPPASAYLRRRSVVSVSPAPDHQDNVDQKPL